MIKKQFLFFTFFFASSLVMADYAYKNVAYFKTLKKFKSVEAFEAGVFAYQQNCLDATFGGTDGIPCLISGWVWDRELNIYYKNLSRALNKAEREQLKVSQRIWIQNRDKTLNFHQLLLNKKHAEIETMGALRQAESTNQILTGILKSRALLLKKWFESTQ